MHWGPLPDVSGLFFAVDVARPGGVPVSATGIEDSPERARRRCAAELAERLALSGRDDEPADPAGTRVSASGAAAGASRGFACERAILEALERLAGALWWHGRLAPCPSAPGTAAAGADLLRRWRRRARRRTELLELPLTACARVVVAVSSGDGGRDMCIGLAARKVRAAAVRDALRELMQMEFGLRVIRFRMAEGIAPAPRETAVLDRAHNLCRGDCAALFRAVSRSPAGPEAARSAPLPERLRKEGYTVEARSLPEQNGLSVMRAHIARDWNAPVRVRGPWTRWALYS